MNKRHLILDLLRACAVILMIIFHLYYDLSVLGIAPRDMNTTFWYYFPRLIVFLFLFSMGVSLKLAHFPVINWLKIKKRLIQLGLFAFIISTATYILFPQNWIYFGTLHCIFVGTILGLPLLRYPKLSWLLIIIIPASYLYFNIQFSDLALLKSIKSMDYIPIYPWLWVILLGQELGPLFLKMKVPENIFFRKIAICGQHSLLLYLLHQPLIYGTLLLYTYAKTHF